MLDLIYKRGQAGVTKASVTIVFNNSDRATSPPDYVNQAQITVTRQVSTHSAYASTETARAGGEHSGLSTPGWEAHVGAHTASRPSLALHPLTLSLTPSSRVITRSLSAR